MSMPQSDPPLERLPAPVAGRDASPRPERPIPSITRDELRAFLARPSTTERIRRLVLKRSGRKTPKTVIEEMLQEANIAVMTDKWGPRSMATARGWLAVVIARAMVSYLGRGAKDKKWVPIDDGVGALATDPEIESEARPNRWLVSRWLGTFATQSERDQETIELVVYKARTSKGYDEIAAEHAMTVRALKSRIAQFKQKYRPVLQRRRLTILVLLVAGAALAALAARLLSHN
jgi:DNA-directed RNA polymerase specialized sigma24 family protein